MTDPLATYLHDHLAGARFAVSLLNDLAAQSFDQGVKALAEHLVEEIEADRLVLESATERIGADSNALKEVAAWVAQKAGRIKLPLNDPLGRFEAIETLCLGVLGKHALWSALEVLREDDCRLKDLELAELKSRARVQHQQLDSLRLQLAGATLRPPPA